MKFNSNKEKYSFLGVGVILIIIVCLSLIFGFSNHSSTITKNDSLTNTGHSNLYPSSAHGSPSKPSSVEVNKKTKNTKDLNNSVAHSKLMSAVNPKYKGVSNKTKNSQKLAFIKKEVTEVYKKIKVQYPEIAPYVVKVNRIDLNENKKDFDITKSDNDEVLFEIITPKSILYTNKSVSYLLVGDLFLGSKHKMVDFTKRPAAQSVLKKAKEYFSKKSSQVNTTNKKETVSAKNVFNSLPLNHAFNYTYGNGDRHIAVFEDPDCPYCEQFHHELKTYGKQLNVKVSVFPFVLKNTHPHGMEHAKSLMCTKNPTKAWNKWMLFAYNQRLKGHSDIQKIWNKWLSENNMKDKIKEGCPQAVLVDGWEVAGHQMGFSATPTIMFEDGTVVEGFIKHDKLDQLLDKIQKKRSKIKKEQ